MQLLIPSAWLIFCIAIGVVLITSLIMSQLGSLFYTFKIVKRKFSIMDLQFPGNRAEIAALIKGVYNMPDGGSRIISALRWQLLVDFLFMPAAYGAVFIICMQFSFKMPIHGEGFFIWMAWLQLIPFLCDLIENIYLLTYIKKDMQPQSAGFFSFYKIMVIIKWTISLFALVCALATALYFWLAGYYETSSTHYVLIIGAEIILAGLTGVFFKKMMEKKSI